MVFNFLTRTAFTFLFFFSTALAANSPTEYSVSVEEWLVAGPLDVPYPVFHSEKNLKGQTFTFKELLESDFVKKESLLPTEGALFGKGKMRWQVQKTENGILALKLKENAIQPRLYYLAAYLQNERFAKVTLELASNQGFVAWLDGERVLAQTHVLKSDSLAGVNHAKTVELEPGKHLLLVKVLFEAQSAKNCLLRARVAWAKKLGKVVESTTSPLRGLSIGQLLSLTTVKEMAVSPDGKLVALKLVKKQPPEGKKVVRIEIRSLPGGRLKRILVEGENLSQLQWAPFGHKLTFVRSQKEKKTLWLLDFNSNEKRALLEAQKDLGNYVWASDGTFLIFEVTEKAPENKSGLKRLQGMPDRWPWWQNRTYLYRLDFNSGIKYRLTAGKLTTSFQCLSPDGSKLLFTRSFPDFSERPYSKTQVLMLHFKEMKLDTLWTLKWLGNILWSPDGRRLLLTGGPSLFGRLGTNVPQNWIANDYDTQAYLYDLKKRKLTAITRDFDPSIAQAIWSANGKTIYFLTIDGGFRRVYQYRLNDGRFKMISDLPDFVHSLSKAKNSEWGVALASAPFLEPRFFAVNFAKGKVKQLLAPAQNEMHFVQKGKVEPWTFSTGQNRTIEGRIYFPPNFDPAKKYPLIVYYYGGTLPTGRAFGGRYPKEVWASHGYVVYVLQPSGAIGFGQKFSALHVNDWGEIVAREIIDGVTKFLRAHPFIDSTRVGCIGASYGGFMTMRLLTLINRFKAAVAHAGISSISSYWGEGYWGYLYSAIATANSFPWNRRDIYVDRSPLFFADRVQTPLLLLHGTADTNVPIGESIQFYTALKLLGRPVELVTIKGENHHILDYKKRLKWSKTILAWFDRWLKDQPEWWEAIYPEN